MYRLGITIFKPLITFNKLMKMLFLRANKNKILLQGPHHCYICSYRATPFLTHACIIIIMRIPFNQPDLSYSLYISLPLRILRSLGSFLDNVNISTSNSTDNVTVFSYTAFSLQIQEIDVSTFGGQTFLVTLGSYEQARNHTQQISRNNLVTFNTVLNSTDANQLNFSEDSTASIQIPSSLSEQLITCSNLTLNQFQRLSYSVFLSDSLFQPKNRSQFRVASIILAPRFHCTLDNISEPIQTTFQTLPEVIVTLFCS